jgi:hypothetical protein
VPFAVGISTLYAETEALWCVLALAGAMAAAMAQAQAAKLETAFFIHANTMTHSPHTQRSLRVLRQLMVSELLTRERFWEAGHCATPM